MCNTILPHDIEWQRNILMTILDIAVGQERVLMDNLYLWIFYTTPAVISPEPIGLPKNQDSVLCHVSGYKMVPKSQRLIVGIWIIPFVIGCHRHSMPRGHLESTLQNMQMD